jgi:CrcB protein
MLPKLLALAAAGALGTVSRYLLSSAVQRKAGVLFPVGTLAVNLAGCFVFGLVWSLAEERGLVHPGVRSAVLIGFLGAFTTFSSFAYETGQLMRDAEWLLAAANVAAQNIGGLLCVALGAAAARLL